MARHLETPMRSSQSECTAALAESLESFMAEHSSASDTGDIFQLGVRWIS